MFYKKLILMKLCENQIFYKKEVIRPQNVEQNLEEALKDFESSKTYSAKEVREPLSKNMGLIYNLR